MSGRHGRMSGSPFHVENIYTLSKKNYDTLPKKYNPNCPHRMREICHLPNSRYYSKRCMYFKCRYFSLETAEGKKKYPISVQKLTTVPCAYEIKGRCQLKRMENLKCKQSIKNYCAFYISREDYFIKAERQAKIKKENNY